MKQAGYHEDYRKHVLLNALAIYDKKVRDDLDGTCPLNRPTGYQKVERKKQRITWSQKIKCANIQLSHLSDYTWKSIPGGFCQKFWDPRSMG